MIFFPDDAALIFFSPIYLGNEYYLQVRMLTIIIGS